jgi:hypothetical protein
MNCHSPAKLRIISAQRSEMLIHANAVEVMPRMIDNLGEPLAENNR